MSSSPLLTKGSVFMGMSLCNNIVYLLAYSIYTVPLTSCTQCVPHPLTHLAPNVCPAHSPILHPIYPSHFSPLTCLFSLVRVTPFQLPIWWSCCGLSPCCLPPRPPLQQCKLTVRPVQDAHLSWHLGHIVKDAHLSWHFGHIWHQLASWAHSYKDAHLSWYLGPLKVGEVNGFSKGLMICFVWVYIMMSV